MKKKILVISHDFVKKVNIKVYEELGKKKNIILSCVRPKKLFLNGKNYEKDFKNVDSNINIFESGTIFNNLRFFYFKNILNIIKTKKPNIVIIHNDPVSLQVIFLIFFSLFFGFSIYCMSNENKIIKNNNKINTNYLFRSIFLLCFNFFIKFKIKKIFCISAHIQKNYNFLGYKKKTILLPLGYDPKIFKKRKKNKKGFVISYFGRISFEKGIHILMKSLEMIKFKFKLYLDVSHIDNQKYFKQIKSQFKNILKKSDVKMIKCDHFEISKYMSQSDLVVLPSIYEEQYGRVLQEAVASGSLVIGSNVGAIPEIINDKDLIFKKNNFKQLASIINKLNNRNFYKNKIKIIYKRILKDRTLQKQLYILEKSI